MVLEDIFFDASSSSCFSPPNLPFVQCITQVFLSVADSWSPGTVSVGGRWLLKALPPGRKPCFLLFVASLLSGGPIWFFVAPTPLEKISHFLIISSDTLQGTLSSCAVSMGTDLFKARCWEAWGWPVSESQPSRHQPSIFVFSRLCLGYHSFVWPACIHSLPVHFPHCSGYVFLGPPRLWLVIQRLRKRRLNKI